MEAGGNDQYFLEKLNLLCKLSKLKSDGVTLFQNYNLHSDLNTMKWEYQLHKNLAELKNNSSRTNNDNRELLNKLSLIESKLDLLLSGRNF